ncbi:hypothetical protein GQ600_19057 [Phytophthora cactorum]|nr:hypothetical protein GQ600_19057 [Phytophthora cactorum]
MWEGIQKPSQHELCGQHNNVPYTWYLVLMLMMIGRLKNRSCFGRRAVTVGAGGGSAALLYGYVCADYAYDSPLSSLPSVTFKIGSRESEIECKVFVTGKMSKSRFLLSQSTTCSIGGYSRAVCFSTGRVLFSDKLKEFDHARLFDGCSNVLAVLDAIHPYLEKFFANNAWMSASTAENTQTTTLQSSTKLDSDGRGLAEEESDSEDSDGPRPNMRGRSSSYPRIKTRWSLPEWLDPNETAEIVIYPGVRTQTRDGEVARRPSTESAGSTRRASYGWSRSAVSQEEEEEMEKRRLIVLPDAHVLGGTFDLSEGSIHIGKHVRIESNVASNYWSQKHSKKRDVIRGDVIVGRNVVLRGEVKNSVILDDAELCHPGYCGDSICGFRATLAIKLRLRT